MPEIISFPTINEDFRKILEILPPTIKENLEQHPHLDQLMEVVMDLGRIPEARFASQTIELGTFPITKEDLNYCITRVGIFSGDNRAGIERTLHRISAIRNRTGEIIGLTCRIGRAIFGTISMISDLVETGKSILLLGRPGVGKTTALREIARVLADDLEKRVIIIDTSNEIAGDGDVPHPAIGRARRMQVARPELQHQVMIEAVENHMPEVIVIDEIGTELEAQAARTIAERGVQLVGTAHGNRLENLIKNPTLSDLVGGIQAVTLGDDEARRRGSQKTVLERKASPTFEIAVEMLERQRWTVHNDVAKTIDELLRNIEPGLEIRSINSQGEVEKIEQSSRNNNNTSSSRDINTSDLVSKPKGWRSSGSMMPVALLTQDRQESQDNNNHFDQLIEKSWYQREEITDKVRTPGPNGEDWPVYVYPYGVSKGQLEQVLEVMELPIVLTKDLDEADIVLTLRAQAKTHSKLRQLAKNRQIPVHAIKANSIPHITKGLRRILGLEEQRGSESLELGFFNQASSEDELEALEETRLAVEQIVIPKGQPVELLPRSGRIRKMQHELVEHYRLNSDSFGEEPNRRLRIYPA